MNCEVIVMTASDSDNKNGIILFHPTQQKQTFSSVRTR